jgi:hypothetical protein
MIDPTEALSFWGMEGGTLTFIAARENTVYRVDFDNFARSWIGWLGWTNLVSQCQPRLQVCLEGICITLMVFRLMF